MWISCCLLVSLMHSLNHTCSIAVTSEHQLWNVEVSHIAQMAKHGALLFFFKPHFFIFSAKRKRLVPKKLISHQDNENRKECTRFVQVNTVMGHVRSLSLGSLQTKGNGIRVYCFVEHMMELFHLQLVRSCQHDYSLIGDNVSTLLHFNRQ